MLMTLSDLDDTQSPEHRALGGKLIISCVSSHKTF